jgi:hypothetical protein
MPGSSIRELASVPKRLVTLDDEVTRQCTCPVARFVMRSIRANAPSVRGR